MNKLVPLTCLALLVPVVRSFVCVLSDSVFFLLLATAESQPKSGRLAHVQSDGSSVRPERVFVCLFAAGLFFRARLPPITREPWGQSACR